LKGRRTTSVFVIYRQFFGIIIVSNISVLTERFSMEETYAKDAASVDAIINALYDSISGTAEQKRDLRRFRSLFIPEARLIRTSPTPEGGSTASVFDVDEYFKTACEYFKVKGFFEREIARRVDSFGNIAHVLSTYESRNNADDPVPFSRGVNSIQLLRDGARWWVVTIFWDFERPDNPIPPEYLP
jgi:hypothetical protein